MNKKGFTLVEILTTVLIIGILSSIALPMYMRAIERSRATEAMSAIKAINDAIYAYASEKEGACPTSYSKLVVTLPSDAQSQGSTSVSTRHFRFDLGSAPVAVPGTDCMGVKATRINGGKYNYWIWNPYRRGTGKGLSLQCDADADNDKSIAICESLGIYENSSAQ